MTDNPLNYISFFLSLLRKILFQGFGAVSSYSLCKYSNTWWWFSWYSFDTVVFRCRRRILLRDVALPRHRKMRFSTVSMVLFGHFEHNVFWDFSKKRAFVRCEQSGISWLRITLALRWPTGRLSGILHRVTGLPFGLSLKIDLAFSSDNGTQLYFCGLNLQALSLDRNMLYSRARKALILLPN